MKYLIFIFSAIFFFNASAQDLVKKLQNQMWYAKGNVYGGEPFAIYNEKPSGCSGYVNFYNNGELEMFLESAEAKFSCFYELQSDSMKVSYSVKILKENETTQVRLLYKLKPLPDNNGFEGIPVKVENK
jgi:hypothetical protein